jgi:copper chaperone
MMSELRFSVPRMTCDHCVQAVSREVAGVAGVEDVEVDLATKAVVVTGAGIDREAVWEAVDEAGYEAVP